MCREFMIVLTIVFQGSVTNTLNLKHVNGANGI